jgi:hypothetical protein
MTYQVKLDEARARLLDLIEAAGGGKTFSFSKMSTQWYNWCQLNPLNAMPSVAVPKVWWS